MKSKDIKRRLKTADLERKKKATALDSVWKEMTPEEQHYYMAITLGGTTYIDKDGNYCVMMGTGRFKKIQEYEKQMLEKYGTAS